MIQLNLLPDVKIAFIKARAQKRLVVLVSFIAGAATLTIFLLLFVYVNVVQSKSSSDLSKDIAASSKELSDTKDLNKILTIQNQLMSIDGLHDQKPATDRLMNYIYKTTPTTISLDQFEVDFEANTVTTTGKSDTLEHINAYVDTIKQTTYTTKDSKTPKKAFSEVVLSSFSRGDDGSSFSVTFKFDPAIFDSKQDIKLGITKKAGNGPINGSDLNVNAFDSNGLRAGGQ